MKRRKLIGRILLISCGALVGYSVYKLWDWNKEPDFRYLEKHKELITSLAETITPSSENIRDEKGAGVADIIIGLLKKYKARKSQNKFIDGLKELQRYCHSSFGKPFEACTPDQKHQTLTHFEERGKSYGGIMGKVEDKFFGKSFFYTLTNITAAAYNMLQGIGK
ncbi:MAG TPA: gluconate 2-dehydrogenase subunit 3 family protein [Puia sp.]|nr:gluconate 2-dehydrogenase subunit 3 family protein [Puia sp.]